MGLGMKLRGRATRDKNTTTNEYHYNPMNNIKTCIAIICIADYEYT